MAINDDLYDRIVQHLADTRLYELETQTNVSRGIRRHQKRLRALLVRDIRANLKPEITRAMKEIHNTTHNSISDFASAATSFHANNLEKSTGKFFKVIKPRGSEVALDIVGPNIQTSKSIRSHFDSIGSAEFQRIQSKVKLGLAEGKSQKEIISSVLDTTRLTESQVKSLVRTSITRTEALAIDRVMERNKDIVYGYRFTAVLDSRTSPTCSSLDGKVFLLDNIKYRPPLHWNCRSALVPVLKSKEEIAKVESDRIKKRALAEVAAGKLNGETPKVEDYSQWLIRQPMNIQTQHLGSEELVSLFQSGTLKVGEFFTPKGRGISIAALRKLDNLRTMTFPTRQAAISKIDNDADIIAITRPYDLLRSTENQRKLKAFYIAESDDIRQAMSLTDFKGTTLGGKRAVRLRANNEFDERNMSFDPFTGEMKSTLLYDPDLSVYQERIDFMKNSKLLTRDQKDFIESFAESLEDQISVNNQSVVVENLRLLFERYSKDKSSWNNFIAVARAEQQFSVTNVSRILDRRSRERAELFAKYIAGEDPKVQIQGKYYSFEDLTKNLLDNQRFVDRWVDNYGRSLARRTYYTGRAPLRSYFFKPNNIEFNDQVHNWIKKNIPGARLAYIRGLDDLETYQKLTKIIGKVKDFTDIDKFLTSKKEQIRRIIDFELSARRIKDKYIKDFVDETLNDKKAIDVISKVFNTIGDGTATDYDSIAINVGKVLRENWELPFPSYKPTLADYHADGSRLLQLLKDQGKIKIQLRGKTRRSVIDLETGRASGAWKDTISREVVIVDKDMLELQSRNRQILLAQRFGIVNSRDKLYIKAGQKTYYDARGKNTSISIITRRASANYDKVLVDKDFAKMLNHTMSVEYETDLEFASFMDDVVRFRDPRGNSAKYDAINEFRKLIIKRGDQGYGFMQTVKWHTQRGKPFTVTAQIDGRGRVYYQGYLTPTGGEVVRPFLNSAYSRQFGAAELRELTTQIGSLIGPATEALTQAGRLEIFNRNQEDLLTLGRLLLRKTQRDRSIREFLEHPLIAGLDAEEVPKMTRLALEYARVHDHVQGDFADIKKLASYQTKLMIENDASSSGAQIIGLSTRDRSISLNSNVVPTNQKNRLYDLVAMDTVSDPAFQAIDKLADANIQWTDLQKAAKAQNMVSFYGAGRATQAANIEAKFAGILERKGYTVITREELRTINNQIDRLVKDADRIGATNTSYGLKQLKRELIEVLDNEVPVGKELMAAARDVHPDVEAFVDKLANTRVGLIGPNEFKQVSEIMSRKLAERAPITQKFVQFWKDAAKSFVDETQKVDIPWVTFDGKVLYQRYRPKIQSSIEFRDPVTGRMVRNIYEAKAEDATLLGKASLNRAGIGMGVNGNHMNDASIVRQYHLWGQRNNVPTATIHDAFFTNIGDAVKSKDALRLIYADALDGDTIRQTLNELRRQGMSRKTYDALILRAKQEGLLDPANGLTREDILAPIRPGYDFYGVGP